MRDYEYDKGTLHISPFREDSVTYGADLKLLIVFAI
jgi:hypothetical protein